MTGLLHKEVILEECCFSYIKNFNIIIINSKVKLIKIFDNRQEMLKVVPLVRASIQDY